MLLAYKYKLKTSPAFEAKLNFTLNACRDLYNAVLQERREAYCFEKKSVSYRDQSSVLPEIKEVNSDYKLIHSQILQDVLKRLDRSFQAFFRRVKADQTPGYPRFKGKNWFTSFCFIQSGFSVISNKLTLSKIGSCRINLSRAVIGKIKTCRIQKEPSGWFVVFTTEADYPELPKTNSSIGLDAGITTLAADSNGGLIANKKFYATEEKAIRRASCSLQRKTKGSKNRLKAKHTLAKIHRRVANRRNDYLHQVTTSIVEKYDLIAIEDLNIIGLSRGMLSKQIHDASWSKFFDFLVCKAEKAGRQLVKVKAAGTSQICICAYSVPKTLNERVHSCGGCGLIADRDFVSAMVIEQRAFGTNFIVNTDPGRNGPRALRQQAQAAYLAQESPVL